MTKSLAFYASLLRQIDLLDDEEACQWFIHYVSPRDESADAYDGFERALLKIWCQNSGEIDLKGSMFTLDRIRVNFASVSISCNVLNMMRVRYGSIDMRWEHDDLIKYNKKFGTARRIRSHGNILNEAGLVIFELCIGQGDHPIPILVQYKDNSEESLMKLYRLLKESSTPKREPEKPTDFSEENLLKKRRTIGHS